MKFEFKVTVHYMAYEQNACSCDALIFLYSFVSLKKKNKKKNKFLYILLHVFYTIMHARYGVICVISQYSMCLENAILMC